MVREQRGRIRLGLGFLGEPSAREMARLSQKAEVAGFESIWVAETRFTRDAITSATAIALATTEVRVGTSAINVFTRGAALTAITMASLDELSHGRTVVGIGAGSEHVLAAQGYTYHRPLRRLRESVEAIRAVWHGEPFHGEFVQIKDVTMDFTPPRRSLPIYLAVSGPNSLAFAGESAEGVILDSFTPVAHTKRAVSRIRSAAERVGRDPQQIEVAGTMMVALDTPESTGRAVLAPLAAMYLTLFPTLAPESGLSESVIAEYVEIARDKGLDVLGQQIPDHVIDTLTVNGSPEQCRSRLQEYRDAGMDLPILVAVPEQIERVITALAPI